MRLIASVPEYIWTHAISFLSPYIKDCNIIRFIFFQVENRNGHCSATDVETGSRDNGHQLCNEQPVVINNTGVYTRR